MDVQSIFLVCLPIYSSTFNEKSGLLPDNCPPELPAIACILNYPLTFCSIQGMSGPEIIIYMSIC